MTISHVLKLLDSLNDRELIQAIEKFTPKPEPPKSGRTGSDIRKSMSEARPQ